MIKLLSFKSIISRANFLPLIFALIITSCKKDSVPKSSVLEEGGITMSTFIGQHTISIRICGSQVRLFLNPVSRGDTWMDGLLLLKG